MARDRRQLVVSPLRPMRTAHPGGYAFQDNGPIDKDGWRPLLMHLIWYAHGTWYLLTKRYFDNSFPLDIVGVNEYDPFVIDRGERNAR